MSEKYSSNNKWPLNWGAFELGGYSYLSQAQTWLDLLDNASDTPDTGKSKTLLTGSDKPVNRADAGECKKQNQQHFSDADAVAAISAMLGLGRIYKESPKQNVPEQVAQHDVGFLRENIDGNTRDGSPYMTELFKENLLGSLNDQSNNDPWSGLLAFNSNSGTTSDSNNPLLTTSGKKRTEATVRMDLCIDKNGPYACPKNKKQNTVIKIYGGEKGTPWQEFKMMMQKGVMRFLPKRIFDERMDGGIRG